MLRSKFANEVVCGCWWAQRTTTVRVRNWDYHEQDAVGIKEATDRLVVDADTNTDGPQKHLS